MRATLRTKVHRPRIKRLTKANLSNGALWHFIPAKYSYLLTNIIGHVSKWANTLCETFSRCIRRTALCAYINDGAAAAAVTGRASPSVTSSTVTDHSTRYHLHAALHLQLLTLTQWSDLHRHSLTTQQEKNLEETGHLLLHFANVFTTCQISHTVYVSCR